jgi:hypothetical protein
MGYGRNEQKKNVPITTSTTASFGLTMIGGSRKIINDIAKPKKRCFAYIFILPKIIVCQIGLKN